MIKTFVFAAATLTAAVSARADECPVGRDPDGIVTEIRQASGCRQASHIARQCASGAGGDVRLTAIVAEICEKAFLPSLDRRGRAIYAQQRAACRGKYRHEDGTLYRSFEAFCEARVSERFAQAAARRKSP